MTNFLYRENGFDACKQAQRHLFLGIVVASQRKNSDCERTFEQNNGLFSQKLFVCCCTNFEVLTEAFLMAMNSHSEAE